MAGTAVGEQLLTWFNKFDDGSPPPRSRAWSASLDPKRNSSRRIVLPESGR
jgi:hypothetical protein